MALTKAEFAAQGENCLNNLILSLAAVSVFTEPGGRAVLNRASASAGPFSMNFDEVRVLLDDQFSRDVALKEFVKMAYRTAIKEGFELVQTYAKETGQFQTFKSFDCYPFLRHFRNAVSHNFRWGLKDQKGRFYRELPIAWSGIELSSDHHGQPVQLEHIGWNKMLELFFQLHAEANAKLS